VRSSKSIDGETDFRQSDLAKAVDKPSLIGDIRDHWFRLARGKQTVVFATDIPHSKHIVETFKPLDVTAEHIDYRMDDDERAAILERFANGATTVLSNCALLSEGWDCPTAEVMVLARPTRSLIRYIQMVGECSGRRPAKSVRCCSTTAAALPVLGIRAMTCRWRLTTGSPEHPAARAPSAGNHCRRKCAKCSLMKPAKIHKCPACGFAPERQNEVQTIAGSWSSRCARSRRPRTSSSSSIRSSCFFSKAGLSSRLGGEPVPDLL
jgi:DNA repair protein RadD